MLRMPQLIGDKDGELDYGDDADEPGVGDDCLILMTVQK